jgi:uncharacterized protein (TIGR02421 family)
MMDEEKVKRLDTQVFEIARNFQILGHLVWPKEQEIKFLRNFKRGNPKLPDFVPAIPDFEQDISVLEIILNECDTKDPVEKFIHDTALSYIHAGRMLESIGTTDFTRYSEMIYGRPDDTYRTQSLNSIDAANFFLDKTEKILGHLLVPKTHFDIDAKEFANKIQPKLDEFFDNDIVDVVIDDKISAKAVAGSKHVKVSEHSHFSLLDVDQLVNHEAFVHSGTLLNGKKQENLKCLSLGAPRTTRTQEGLAVLSELATTSIDIMRLRRVALRVIAVKMALDGADFIDLYKYFNEQGQSEVESFRSAQRIFRGGGVGDGIVFTKDSVYLSGIFEALTFMKIAISKNKPEYIYHLYAGRLTLGDVIRLAPLFDNGWLRMPDYIPPWSSDIRRVAAMLAFSSFETMIQTKNVSFKHFMFFEEQLKRRGMPEVGRRKPNVPDVPDVLPNEFMV